MSTSTHSVPGSKKRTAAHFEDDGNGSQATTAKVTKVFPIFGKPSKSDDTSSSFRWLPALGPHRTCFHGVNLAPQASTKVAAFDLDGCLIESSFPKKAKGTAQGPPFRWWRPSIPSKLKEVHDAGYAIVIVSNQALRSAALADWKKKIPGIGAALPDVPFRIFAASAKDGYRKPMPGIWYELERMFMEDNVQIDKLASFFVGDAAGRARDHAGSDRKWALNIHIPFFTPEEYFLKLPPAPYELKGFHVSSLPTNVPHITPTSSPLIPLPSKDSSKPEIVVFVGYPAMGKSSFYRTNFQPSGYVHVNQDTLGNRTKCIKAVEGAIEAGQSCVVDNTNRDAQTRKHYIDVAEKHGISIRCVLFEGSMELAWHNNLYRAFNLPPSIVAKEPKRDLLPFMAFTSFRSNYEEPKLEEGFAEIKKVNWIFSGDAEERKYWSMWLQVDGK